MDYFFSRTRWLLEWVFVAYFLGTNGSYLILNVLSFFSVLKAVKQQTTDFLPGIRSQQMPPVTIIVPAYNEEKNIVSTVQSIYQLDYPKLNVVVVNDGSTDNTMGELKSEFNIRKTNRIYREQIATKQVRSVSESALYKNLSVIDKENGGKADALNAGINLAETPLVCCVDGDSILTRESLKVLVRPFLFDPDTVAAGGTVRVGNGSNVEGGFMKKVALPNNLLGKIQVVEYLRAFFFGRLGWEPLNSVMIISGAFGLFDRNALLEAGGYRTDTVGEDMELVMRLHRTMIARDRSYSIRYVPDPVCWTEVPEDLSSLASQRIRWQRGLSESLSYNIGLLKLPTTGAVYWAGFPYMTLFEWFGPIIELMGYLYMIPGFFLGYVSVTMFWTFLLMAMGLGVVVSVTAFLIEELTFHLYPKMSQVLILIFMGIVENLGYRQINSWWRFRGLWKWLRDTDREWGTIRRQGWGNT